VRVLTVAAAAARGHRERCGANPEACETGSPHSGAERITSVRAQTPIDRMLARD
jgi:hypothetical protein